MAQILIIEDSMYQRNRICKALNKEGYELLEAANGQEGLDMLLAHHPDCILLDLVMPEVSGLDVLQTLADRDVNIPVIVHTSDIQDTTREHCLALGAVAFLNKPLKENELLAAINQALGSQDGEREDAR